MAGPDILTVDYSKRQDSQKIFTRPATLSSHDDFWTDIFLEYHNQPGCDTGKWVAPVHRIAINIPDCPHRVERWLDGRFQAETVSFGDVAILPAGVTHRTRWRNKAKFLILSLEPSWLQQIGEEVMECDRIQLLPKAPPLQDPLIQGIALALKQVLEKPSDNNSLYVDQLKRTLGLHLLRGYTTQPSRHAKCDSGLSRYQLRQAIEYIHARLDQDIKLSDIASLLGMSQYYFCRLFHRSVGVSPYRYVIQQRIERAKQMLRQDRYKAIADIALECGFSSQSHLTQQFSQMTGTTPRAYRRKLV
ncbi:MAG: AraC family transcriptional regulator [Cyanobacteria bacterium P01_A01_bin.17]